MDFTLFLKQNSLDSFVLELIRSEQGTTTFLLHSTEAHKMLPARLEELGAEDLRGRLGGKRSTASSALFRGADRTFLGFFAVRFRRGDDFRWLVQPLFLPVQASADCPRQDSGHPQFFR